MRRVRRVAVVAGAVLAGVVLLVGAVVLVLTRTDWGRERVRAFGVEQLAQQVAGRVRVGRIEGQLLHGATMLDVVVEDSAGAPFLRADTLSAQYSLRSFLSKRLVFTDVLLANATLVLEQDATGRWNYQRLFPRDTTAVPDTLPGFGSWVRLEEVTIRNATVIVRAAWSPPDTLSGAARERAVRQALSRDSRLRVVSTPDGYRAVSEFHDLDAQLPLVLLADPDSAARLIRVASLTTLAYPFRPPAARVQDLAGSFTVTDDTLFFRDAQLALPETQLRAEGAYGFEDGGVRASVRAGPLSLADFRWIRPDLPEATGQVAGRVSRAAAGTHVLAETLELRAGGSRVAGHLNVRFGDTLRLDDTRLVLDEVDTELIERLRSDASLPVSGWVSGEVRLAGRTTSLRVNGWAAFRERGGGTSRVVAEGGIGTSDGELRADALRLRLEPVRVALLRAFAPGLPLDGALSGTATVDGSPSGRVAANVDLLHTSATGRTRLIGDASVRNADVVAIDADLRLPVLSLATVGRFAPAAGLRGTASGNVAAEGTLRDLAVALDLGFGDAGAVAARGTLDLASARTAYDVDATLAAFDPAAVTTRAPASRLNGRISVNGRGTDPATMNALLNADLRGVEWDSARVDSAVVRAGVAGGVAYLQQADVHLASATAHAEGSFGLVPGRSGEVRYDIAVDSLRDFARWLPGDTIARTPRPLLQARRVAAARADSARHFLETEVERAATGYPPSQSLDVDSVPPLPGDSLAGSVRASGTLAGNVDRFDLRGELEGDHVVMAGNAAAHIDATYALLGIGAPDPTVELDAAVDSLLAGGFAFDSATVDAAYTGVRDRGRGTVVVAAFADSARDYRLASSFLVELDRREVELTELALRFDTMLWTAPQPSEVRWGGPGVSVDSLALVSDAGGSIFIDGQVPIDGPADVRVRIDGLPLGHVTALLQDTLQASGLLQLDARLEGPRAAPRLSGDASLLAGSFGTRRLPDVSTRFDYADRELNMDALLARDGLRLADVEAMLPIDLSLAGVDGSRLLDGPVSGTLRADSLPLEALPSFTDAVQDVRGRLRGEVTVAGTFREPELGGAIALDLARMDIVEPGVQLRDIAGAVVFAEDAARLDSMVMHSGGGPIRIDGTIGLETLARPIFDLSLNAEDARLLDNRHGRVRADATLAMAGPIDSLRITGDVDVQDGVIYVPDPGARRATELDDPVVDRIVRPAEVEEGVLPSRNPLLENLDVDVSLRVQRNTWVRNTGANVEIYSPDDADPLQVRLADGQLTLDGVINTDRGEYAFSGRVFDVTTGSVTFLGGRELDPLLQITARYEVPRRGREALAIQVHIVGTLSEPRLALESTAQPPLPESDLLAFLAFGRSSSSLLNLDDSGVAGGGSQGSGGIGALAQQQLAGLAVGALVDEAVSDLEREGTRAGLDVFRIHSAELPEELAFESYFGNLLRGTEIEAGKYLGGRLFLGAQGRTTTLPGVRVEYTARGGFTWTATWEPRFLPALPTLADESPARSARTFGTFLIWKRRF